MGWLFLLRKLAGLVPWQAWALAAFLGVAGIWHWREMRAAVGAALSALERQSEAQTKDADQAEMDVLRCPPGKWNREKSKCEP